MTVLLTQLLLLIFASIILVKSATLLVTSISVIGKRFKLTEFTISFILMGIVTSLPEISVALNASLSHNSTLALGTALGSNITNLTLVIAIPVLVAKGFRVRSIIARKDSLIMAVFAFVPILLALDGLLSRIDAIILLIFYALYLYRLISQRSYFPDLSNYISRKDAIYQTFIFVTSTILLFSSGKLLVDSAVQIAQILRIPTMLIGLILVSVGTSLPELAHGLRAVKLNHNGQVLGDILGSVVSNATVVLAIAALVEPIKLGNFSPLLTSAFFLFVVIALFLIGVYTDKKLSLKEALVLLAAYFIFVTTELGLQIVDQSVL